MNQNPEIGRSIQAAGIKTNFHDAGEGFPVLFIHGSGPGSAPGPIGAWRCPKSPKPIGSSRRRWSASAFPSARPMSPIMWTLGWRRPLACSTRWNFPRPHVVGNSFGGAIALALAIRHPERVGRLVLMGSVGVPFPITEGLDRVWGYQPSFENMRGLLDIFAFSRELVNDELAELRYRASIRPGFQKSFSAMFPAPRQRWVDAMASAETDIRALKHETLIVHGRDDKVIPLQNSLTLLDWIDRSQLHVFGRCGHWVQIEHAASFASFAYGFPLREGQELSLSCVSI